MAAIFHLPPELLRFVVAQLAIPDLLALVLVSRQLRDIAAQQLYDHPEIRSESHDLVRRFTAFAAALRNAGRPGPKSLLLAAPKPTMEDPCRAWYASCSELGHFFDDVDGTRLERIVVEHAPFDLLPLTSLPFFQGVQLIERHGPSINAQYSRTQRLRIVLPRLTHLDLVELEEPISTEQVIGNMAQPKSHAYPHCLDEILEASSTTLSHLAFGIGLGVGPLAVGYTLSHLTRLEHLRLYYVDRRRLDTLGRLLEGLTDPVKQGRRLLSSVTFHWPDTIRHDVADFPAMLQSLQLIHIAVLTVLLPNHIVPNDSDGGDENDIDHLHLAKGHVAQLHLVVRDTIWLTTALRMVDDLSPLDVVVWESEREWREAGRW